MNPPHAANARLLIRPRPGRANRATIARPRLFALLDDLSPVTLIAAPTGYGKSVLIG